MTYLEKILTVRRAAVARRMRERPLEAVVADARARTERRDFAGALRAGWPSVIAEFKRSSPSAGTINAHADPAAIARAYERGGAAALSVLTEPDSFRGSFDDLCAARSATRLPVLCKDFIIDAYQVWEAVAAAADAVLLIVAALSDASLRALLELADELSIAALVEAHDAGETQRALDANARIIGVNNRDLRTFSVDTATALRARPSIPPFIPVVAESGYHDAADLEACARAGIDAVLIGEALMRSADPENALRRMRGVPA